MENDFYDVARENLALRVTDVGQNGTHYWLRARQLSCPDFTLLCFSITREGYLIGDGKDLQTARRAQRLTRNWA